MNASRPTVVGLILAATVLFVVGIIWEKNSGEHHSDAVAQAAKTAAEHAAESGGGGEATTTTQAPATKPEKSGASAEGQTTQETPTEHAGESGGESQGEVGGETHGEPGNDEQVLGINYESTPLVILAVLASLGLAAVVWFARVPSLLLVVAAAMLAFAVFDIAEVFHQVDRDEAGIAVLAGFVAVLHLGAGIGSAQLRHEPAAS